MERKILDHFKKSDPLLYSAYLELADKELMTIHVPTDHFSALCREIIGQQLSSKAALVIFGRFRDLFPKKKITSKHLVKIKPEDLRSVGLSNSKAAYLKDLAGKVESGELSLEKISKMDDESVVRELTKVKGIGPWTAEMFLIFSLNRQDVFSLGDLGLKNAIRKIYKLKDIDKTTIEKIVPKWSPYKSFACRIVWRSLD